MTFGVEMCNLEETDFMLMKQQFDMDTRVVILQRVKDWNEENVIQLNNK